jgi:hypothetical protein
MHFGECVKKLHIYTSEYGWKCSINSWIRKQDQSRVWVITLLKGPVAVRATGKSLQDASAKMIDLIEITEKIALCVE